MITVKAHMDNSDIITTGINGTLETAIKYYVGKKFNLGVVADKIVTCTSVELVDEAA